MSAARTIRASSAPFMPTTRGRAKNLRGSEQPDQRPDSGKARQLEPVGPDAEGSGTAKNGGRSAADGVGPGRPAARSSPRCWRPDSRPRSSRFRRPTRSSATSCSKLRQLDPDDLEAKLVIGGFVDHPYGPDKQRCMECMYYLVHRKWCDLPELAVPVEPEWWCRLWRI